MATLQATDLADLVATTLNNLGRLKFNDVMTTYQNTTFFKRLIKRGKMTFDGGTEAQFNLITDTNHSARSVGLYYTANVNPTNVMLVGKMPWRHMHWDWGVERREIAMNSASANKIVDLLKTRRIAALASAVVDYEQKGWRLPAATNDLDFQGVPYWVVKSNTAVTTNDGFNGGLPSGYSTVANIDPTGANITPKWNNYATQYTLVTKDDLVDKMWRASDYTDFMPLVEDVPTYNTGDDYGYYTTYAVRKSMKYILESQNEDLGMDLDPTNGKLVFRRAPVTWIKELDKDTTGPVYGLNWGVFKFMGLRGEWLREVHIPYHSNQPTVAATHTDCSGNTYCTDRRRNFVLATDTTLPG